MLYPFTCSAHLALFLDPHLQDRAPRPNLRQ